MITYSGVHIQKEGGAAGIPRPIDIAVQSARITRYAGAIWMPLLAHIVFVGLMAYRRSGSIPNMIGGFLHDGHEVATGEICAPFKCDCMRREQRLIDDRIRDHYCRGLDIDWALIKECDIDACEIEGVQLGLPDFERLQLAGYTDRTELYADPDDIALFSGIYRSDFYTAEVIDPLSSKRVVDFIEILTALESFRKDRLDRIRAIMEKWGL